jgi:hypothetical protein
MSQEPPSGPSDVGELRERFAKFGLGLHPDKTRLIEFGRYAARDRKRRGLGKQETFDFLEDRALAATLHAAQHVGSGPRPRPHNRVHRVVILQ